jgi:hypothetical protein
MAMGISSPISYESDGGNLVPRGSRWGKLCPCRVRRERDGENFVLIETRTENFSPRGDEDGEFHGFTTGNFTVPSLVRS